MRNLKAWTVLFTVGLFGWLRAGENSMESTPVDTGGEYDLSLENLLNLEVTVASKKAENISDAPGIISVIAQDEIHRSGATTLREVLLRAPSVGMATCALSNRSLPVIRGDLIKTNSSHILFLLNGRPMREIQEGGVNSDVIESFPVDIVERIEIIRGPGSVLYGSDAFSGVINIITKQPTERPVSASITGHYEPLTGGGGSGNVRIKSGDLSIAAAGRYYQKPDWDVPLKWVRESRLTFIPTLYAVPIHDTVMDKGPGAFVNLDYKGLSAAGSYMKWTSRAFQALNNLDDVKYFGNIGYKTKVSDNWQTEMNVTGVRAEIFTDDVQFIERHSNNLLFENTNFLTLAKDLNVVAGGTANYIEGREKYTFPMESGAEPYFTSSGNRWAFALYGQADYTLRNTVKLITGLQANKTRGIKEHIAPRIGAIVHPTREISIKAFYSEAFRLPSINELFMNFNVGLFGDRQLKPEVVKTTDLGVTYQIDKMMIGATFFHSKQTDIIQQTLLPGSITARRYSNLGTVNFTGVELEGKCYISERLYADASLLFQNNKDSAFGVVPYANFGAKGSLSYEHERGFTLTLSDAYQGPLDDKFNGKFNNQGNSGAFQLLNFSSQWNLGKLFALQVRLDPTILFKVDNLVGREIWMYEYGGFSNDVIPVMRGREFYIGMNLSL